MNCDDFNEWLHEQLDERRSAVISPAAKQHLQHCEVCCQQLDAWKQIATILPAQHPTDTVDAAVETADWSSSPTWLAIAGVTVMFAVVLSIRSSLKNSPMSATSVAGMHPVAISAAADKALASSKTPLPLSPGSEVALGNHSRSIASIDPSRWWQTVRQRDWIDSTLPTVQSMRDGVAPLGRSFSQAVTLLTQLGGDKTS